MDHKIDDLLRLLISLQIGINLVSLLVVSHGLIIALEIFKDGRSIVIQVRVWLLL